VFGPLKEGFILFYGTEIRKAFSILEYPRLVFANYDISRGNLDKMSVIFRPVVVNLALEGDVEAEPSTGR
jgi:hypothetical protein